MARAYLQRQGQEREPVSARPDGPHLYRCYQKQDHQCHHHHPVAGDVHGPPSSGLPGGSSTKERWQGRQRKPVE